MLQSDGSSSQSNILSPMPLHREARTLLAALPFGPTAVAGPHAPKPAVRGDSNQVQASDSDIFNPDQTRLSV
jgi:hypothetical protein